MRILTKQYIPNEGKTEVQIPTIQEGRTMAVKGKENDNRQKKLRR
jgi:hypothetical protein